MDAYAAIPDGDSGGIARFDNDKSLAGDVGETKHVEGNPQ